jgi:hypothetical protein
MRWERIVVEEKDLNDNNWLYVGNNSKNEVERQINAMKRYLGIVPIIEE